MLFAGPSSFMASALLEVPGAVALPLDPVLIPAGIVLITGVFMLLVGRRMLRCGLGIIGALAGCLLGNALAPLLPSVLSPVVLAVIGGLLGLGLGLLLWRFTVASIMAGSCATAAALALLLAINGGLITPVAPAPTETKATTSSLTTTPVGTVGIVDTHQNPSFEERVGRAALTGIKGDAQRQLGAIETGVNAWLHALNDNLGGLFTRMHAAWDRLESPVRTAVAGTAVLGALFGFLFGLVAWKWSGALVTALAGAGLVLLGALLLVGALSPVSGASLWELPPGVWLGGWAILAASGALISWYIERRRADTECIEPA